MFKKVRLVLIYCCFVSVAIADNNRFIIKYKPNITQSKMLAQGGVEAMNARAQMVQPLAQAQIKRLSSFVNGAQVKEINQIATGAHVIIIINKITNKNLNEIETKKFIDNVQKDSNVEYFEEDRKVKPLDTLANPNLQWDMYTSGEFTPHPQWIGDNFSNAWDFLSLFSSLGFGVGKNVVVGVVDTGYTPHPNFLNALQPLGNTSGTYGYQFISDCRISGQCPPSTPTELAYQPYQPNGLDLGNYVSQKDIDTSEGFFPEGCLSLFIRLAWFSCNGYYRC